MSISDIYSKIQDLVWWAWAYPIQWNTVAVWIGGAAIVFVATMALMLAVAWFQRRQEQRNG
jgi:hypothetical protein